MLVGCEIIPANNDRKISKEKEDNNSLLPATKKKKD
jgi:hypothetical protein